MPDFRQSTPASAATLGRLSKITATTPSGTRTRSMVMPFGRCQLSVTTPTGSAIARTVAMPSAMASTRACVSVRRSMKAPVIAGAAGLGHVLGIGRENRGRIGADGALHRLQRAVLLLRRRQRQHPRRGLGAGSEVVHQGRQIGIAVDGFQGRGHGSFGLSLRPCRSMEIEALARRGTGMAGGQGGPGGRPMAYLAGIAPAGPTTRSSRWIISARPLMPRIAITSGEERPLIFSASSAS